MHYLKYCGIVLLAPSKQVRKPMIYDPIAKSIADYVANNVPDKMNKVIKFF